METSSRGSSYESGCPSALCSVSSTAGRLAASGRAPPPEPSCGVRPSQRESADGSLHISSGTRTPSKGAREDVPLVVIQRQLGHGNLGITSLYLQGIDKAEIIVTVHAAAHR